MNFKDNNSTLDGREAHHHSSHSSQQMSGGFNEDDRGTDLLQILQSAKQEMEILENLKTLALDIFNMAI
jgi:hypothetical protein